MGKKTGIFLMVAGFLLLMASAGLTAYNIWDASRAADSSIEIGQQLNVQIPDRKPAVLEADALLNSVQVAENTGNLLLAEVEIPDYILVPDMEMPEEVVDGIAYIGMLEIPDLGLSLPVSGNWSYPLLKKSPCRYTGSAYTNDLVIAAHNYARHFGNLEKLFLDSQILFTDVSGNVFEYKVAELETLAATDIDAMTSDTRGLTLFTCTVGGKSRIAVRAERVDAR